MPYGLHRERVMAAFAGGKEAVTIDASHPNAVLGPERTLRSRRDRRPDHNEQPVVAPVREDFKVCRSRRMGAVKRATAILNDVVPWDVSAWYRTR
jgi:hypothetical protein